MRRAVPWILAGAFAAFSDWPRAQSIPGWGGDPFFNLWSFEVVWHNLRAGLPLFGAPLFAGSPLGLAFSENQIAPALLLWPVRALTGNGALTLGIGAIALSLLAVACAAAWLRAIGIRDLSAWGGLLFAGCGWLQSQYAHFQNLCIFVLPLALWAWSAYAREPRPLRLLLCALAFAWIAAWNLYFLVFADFCLLVLAVRARRPAPLALALAIEAAFLVPYFELGRVLGGYGGTESYGAALRSVLGSTLRPRLFAPSFEVDLEAAGYLGVVWLALIALCARRRESRPWLLAAALAFWAALGRGYGLYDLLSVLPPVSSLRAAGRAQVLVFLFTLPAVLGWLQTLRPFHASAAVALAVADLLPASATRRTPIDPALWGPPATLARELSRSADPVLVLPAVDERFMLEATQSWIPYFGGVSGRLPPGEDLVRRLSLGGRWSEALELSRAHRVLALTPAAADEVRKLPQVSPRGCFGHVDGTPACLFEAGGPQPSLLRLDRDTRSEQSRRPGWPATDFFAAATGVLDARQLDRCHALRTARILGLPLRSALPLVPGPERARYVEGERVLRLEALQALFHLPLATAEFELRCE